MASSGKYLVLLLAIIPIFAQEFVVERKKILGYEYPFEIIADLDKKALTSGQKNTYVSNIQLGSVYVLNNTITDITLSSESHDVVTKYSFNGRGAELSELLIFHEKLYTFDDKSGIIFDVEKDKLIPWVILSDGAGNETNGFKCEWATVKDDHVIVGSHGVESMTPEGKVKSRNAFYVKKITEDGGVIHENWFEVYDKLRRAVGMPFPGFVVHEAALWSAINEKWIFLPRKCSKEPMNSDTFDYIGCNLIILANEDFSKIESHELSDPPLVNHRGFSSFQFLPNTDEKIIIALTTIETVQEVATYIIALDIEGKVLFPETKILSEKFEGLSFLQHLLGND
ncbi:apyrase-like [Phlebotomus argentipes]|uniref:apyrase-like n=1 Tax=Phlebotomus argentipes TaxID=94469 RepID=UPI0028930DDF|nr:apyrase-like [Phlebotomus argentipes]